MDKKKTILISAISAIVIAILTIGVLMLINHNNETSGIVTDNTDTISITQDTHSGVPYRWEFNIADPTIVQIVGENSQEMAPELAGGPVVMTYYFKGLREGQTEITFKYTHVGDGTVAEIRSYRVYVDSNLITSYKGISVEHTDDVPSSDLLETNSEPIPSEAIDTSNGTEDNQATEEHNTPEENNATE